MIIQQKFCKSDGAKVERKDPAGGPVEFRIYWTVFSLLSGSWVIKNVKSQI